MAALLQLSFLQTWLKLFACWLACMLLLLYPGQDALPSMQEYLQLQNCPEAGCKLDEHALH